MTVRCATVGREKVCNFLGCAQVRAELTIHRVDDQIVSKKAEVDAWLKKEEGTGAFMVRSLP